MPKLTITSPEDGGNARMASELDILVDGEPIHEVIGPVREIHLAVVRGEIVTAQATFMPDSVEVSTEALMKLQALVEEKDVSPPEGES